MGHSPMEPNTHISRSISDVSSFSTVSVLGCYTIRVFAYSDVEHVCAGIESVDLRAAVSVTIVCLKEDVRARTAWSFRFEF